MAAPQQIPLTISVAPFPEGFEGDMDEHAQQLVALMEAFVEGNFLTGLILPPGSTLPTSDQGPIAMGGVWYFFDPTTGQYLPQTVSSKVAKNFVKNCVYQVQQTGSTWGPSPSNTLGAGATNTYDMVVSRSTVSNVLAIAPDVGPTASVDNDYCPTAIKYTVTGSPLVPTPTATSLYAHEHLIEGSDIAMIQGETLSLAFSVSVNQPGTYSYYLTSNGRDCSYVGNFTITTANTWTRIKVTGIPPFPTTTGTWNFSEGATGLYIGIVMCVGTQWQQVTANLNKWNAGFWAGSAANTNLCTVVNNQIKISGVKLEASPQVSYLSVPSFDADFWECLRYYYTTFNYQSVTAGIPILLTAPLAGQYATQFAFPRRMAKVPTVVPFGYVSHATGQITDMSVPTPVDIPVATLAAVQKGICDRQTLSTISTTGTLTVNSGAISAIPSTTGMRIGQPITGAGLIANSAIVVIVSGTAININTPAAGSATGVALTIYQTNMGETLWALITADARLT